MLRRLLAPALCVLGLLAAVAPAATGASAPAAGAAKPNVTNDFSVYFRRADSGEWKVHGHYADLEKAKDAAVWLYRDGHDVRIHQVTTILRPRTTPAAPASKAVLTPEQAQAVFDVMAGRRDIAFRYPTDGCYARAHLMVKHMLALGYKPGKVWAFAHSKKEPLYARTTNHPRGYVKWRWHVAPVLRVRGDSGKARWFVIDPSLFRTPVPVVRWKGRMRRAGARGAPYITVTRLGEAPRDKYGRRYPGTGYRPTADPAQGIDAHALITMRRYKAREGKSVARAGTKGLPRLSSSGSNARPRRLPRPKSTSTGGVTRPAELPRALGP
jgi:hypothetical protein